MPRGDRTGPMGTGPHIGRGAGWCVGYEGPGYANPAPRLGLGLGYRGGRGRGNGRRNMYYATGLPGWARAGAVPSAPASGQELADLKAQAGQLAGQLGSIQRRIEEIAGRGAAPAEA